MSKLVGGIPWFMRVRPAIVADFLRRLYQSGERRRVVFAEKMGLYLYLDPWTAMGSAVIQDGVYEPETAEIFESELKAGDVVLDIGANEGIYSAYAGRLVGERGIVIAVEPQSALRDIIHVNLALNGVRLFRIYTNAIGGDDGERAILNLFPVNSGASSLARRYHWSRRTESVAFVSLDRILNESKLSRVDFVKVDVEGYEGHVIAKLAPHMRAGRIRKLLVDYHDEILRRQGIDPGELHRTLLKCGMRVRRGDERHLQSYLLYEHAGEFDGPSRGPR